MDLSILLDLFNLMSLMSIEHIELASYVNGLNDEPYQYTRNLRKFKYM